MTRLACRILTALSFTLLAAGTAGAGPIELADDISAKLARVKVQQAAVAEQARAATQLGGLAGPAARGGGVSVLPAGAGGVPGNGCSIAVGNVFEDRGRPSTNARRETTVIITGDIIQVGNNCR